MSIFLGWLLLIVQILFGVAAVGTFVYAQGDDPRLRNFLASATFFVAAAGSYYLGAWWPLFAGFGLLWVYKFMGLDPADNYRQNLN
jgi:hypothetical protein